jgi:hypothetical protein
MCDGCDNGKPRETGQRPLNAAPRVSLAGVL